MSRISSKFRLYHINFIIFFALALVLFASAASASHDSFKLAFSIGRTEPRFDDGIFSGGVSGSIFLKRLEPVFEQRPRRDVSLEASVRRLEPQFESRRGEVSLGISVNRIEPSFAEGERKPFSAGVSLNRIEPKFGDKSAISGGISVNRFQPGLGSNFLRGTSFSQRFAAPSGGAVSLRFTPVFGDP